MPQSASFGAKTDHWGIATADMEVVASSSEPRAMARADAQDANGDIAAAAWFGNTAGTLLDVSVTYALVSGTLDLSTLSLGELTAGSVVASITVGTSNTGWPQITVAGVMGAQTITAPTGFLNTYSLPAITLTGRKAADAMGATVGADFRVTGSDVTFTADIAQQDTGEGEPAAHGISGAIGVLSQTLVKAGVTTLTWAPPSGWTETKTEGTTQDQAAWNTTTVGAEYVVARDAAAP